VILWVTATTIVSLSSIFSFVNTQGLPYVSRHQHFHSHGKSTHVATVILCETAELGYVS